MSSEWELDPPSHHEWTLESSTSNSTTERNDRPIQNGQTDHLRLHVAVKRGTLLRLAPHPVWGLIYAPPLVKKHIKSGDSKDYLYTLPLSDKYYFRA